VLVRLHPVKVTFAGQCHMSNFTVTGGKTAENCWDGRPWLSESRNK